MSPLDSQDADKIAEALDKRRHQTGEQQLVDPNKTWVSVGTLVSIVVAALSVGGFIWQSRAVAADVEKVKEAIEKKADKAQAETREARLAAIEKFVAVQMETNKQQAEINAKAEKAAEKNEAQHDKLGEKLDKVLDAVKRRP